MNRYFSIITLFGIVQTATLECMVAYKQLECPDGKQILLLGEKHDISREEARDHSKACIAHIARASLIHPLSCIVEYENQTGTAFDQNDSDKGLVGSLSEMVNWLVQLQEAYKKESHCPFNFEFYDPRNEISGQITGIIDMLSRAIRSEVPREKETS